MLFILLGLSMRYIWPETHINVHYSTGQYSVVHIDIYSKLLVLCISQICGGSIVSRLQDIIVIKNIIIIWICLIYSIAGASSTTYAYLGEFFIARHRPVVINYTSMFVGVSMTYVPAVAWLVLSMDWSFEITESFVFRPWRLLTIFNILPGFIAVLIMITLPDSPKILMSMHKYDEAYEAVNWIAKNNTGRCLQDFKVFKLLDESLPAGDKILHTSKSA